jgi:hypothetical protein
MEPYGSHGTAPSRLPIMLVDVACVEVACVEDAFGIVGGQNSEGDVGGIIIGIIIGSIGNIGIMPPA